MIMVGVGVGVGVGVWCMGVWVWCVGELIFWIYPNLRGISEHPTLMNEQNRQDSQWLGSRQGEEYNRKYEYFYFFASTSIGGKLGPLGDEKLRQKSMKNYEKVNEKRKKYI